MRSSESQIRVDPSYGKPAQRYLVIRINHSHAGFFAYVNFALNQLVYAEKNGLHPVVYFGPSSEDGPNAFHDASRGQNMWDYYFQPVADLTYDDLQARLDAPDDPLSPGDLVRLSNKELWDVHCREADSIFPYPHSIHVDSYRDDPQWYDKQRSRAQKLVRRYVRVKPHVLSKVDAFEQEHFRGHTVLGIHLRGTDKGTARGPIELMRIVEPKEYFPHIDDYLRKSGDCKIFVATDQVQFVDTIRKRYGSRVMSYESMRTTGARNPFEYMDGLGYRKGEDVLIDCLLLSRCNYLLKCTSAVGEFAMYFNPDLECKDLNHEPRRVSVVTQMTIYVKRRAYRRYLKRRAKRFRQRGAS